MTRASFPATVRCALVLGVAATSGCGIFESSTSQASLESSSQSSSSPFKSSSRSSDGNDSSALARDVRDYSAAYVRAAGNVQTFRRDVGAIARAYGVFDWQADPAVHRAMGRGFREAGLDAASAKRLGTTVSGDDPARLAWVMTGYRSAGGE